MSLLQRRGFNLGKKPGKSAANASESSLERWHSGLPVVLRQQVLNSISGYSADIANSEKLVRAILAEQGCDAQLAQSPYLERLEPRFQSLGSIFNEGDQQEIEMVLFDAIENNEIIAEDLWLKASWLSFYAEDASLRFRFSFGIDLEEDVAADPHRQQLAAELTDAVFPESAIITTDEGLRSKLRQILGGHEPHFVERIIYFNAPDGGAYLHHDLERGHAGVVFAQLTGQTFWLALPKTSLINEVIAFARTHPWPESLTLEMRTELSELISNRSLLADELNSFANSSLIHLINETKEFVQFLVARGHSYQLNPGDALLLPQAKAETCCWHSVFCLGDEMGQALSFAVRPEFRKGGLNPRK